MFLGVFFIFSPLSFSAEGSLLFVHIAVGRLDGAFFSAALLDTNRVTSEIHINSIRGRLRWFRWRGAVLILVFLLGLVAFCGGAEASDRDVRSADFMAKVYYTLGLFVLGGLDLGVPVRGPMWARAMLWLVYFAAPAITTSALVEGILRAIRPDRFRLRQLRQHVVIAGCGRLAMLYLECLREAEPNTPVLIIDNRADNPHAQTAIERFRANVLIADVTSKPAIRMLRLKFAKRLVVLTGDDYINLDTATKAISIAPHLATQTLVHISDLRLLRVVEKAELLQQATKFNSYRRAAESLVDENLLPHFRKTDSGDIVVLAGFGRFGQSVLDQLQQHAAEKFSKVVIVDQQGDLQTMVFADQVGFQDGYEWHLLAENLQHPRTWQRVAEEIDGAGEEPVYILGSGDDSVNIRTALWLSRKYPKAKVLARCFRRSTFAEQISSECDFELVSTADLLLSSMNPKWLGSGVPR